MNEVSSESGHQRYIQEALRLRGCCYCCCRRLSILSDRRFTNRSEADSFDLVRFLTTIRSLHRRPIMKCTISCRELSIAADWSVQPWILDEYTHTPCCNSSTSWTRRLRMNPVNGVSRPNRSETSTLSSACIVYVGWSHLRLQYQLVIRMLYLVRWGWKNLISVTHYNPCLWQSRKDTRSTWIATL